MGLFRVLQLIITGDSKSATRAIGDVGTASEQTSKKVSEHNKTTSSGFENVHKSASKVHDKIGMLGSAVGLGGLAFGLKDVASAGIQSQASQSALQVALRNTHKHALATGSALSSMAGVADSASVHGGFAAPQEMAALTRYVTLTKSASEATLMNRDAMNLARGAHLSYQTAVDMVGRAYTGTVGRMKPYVGAIQPVKTAELALSQAHKTNIFQLELQSKSLGKAGALWLRQKELYAGVTPAALAHAKATDLVATRTQILTAVQSKWGGQMNAFSGTAAGKISKLDNSMELLNAHLGTALLPTLEKFVGWLSSATGWMSKHQGAVTDFAIGIGGLAVVTWGLSAATNAWKVAQAAAGVVMAIAGPVMTAFGDGVLWLGGAFEAMGIESGAAWVLATGGMILLVAGVIAGVALIVTHWKWFKGVVTDVWDGVESVVGSVTSWLAGAVGSVISWVGNHWQLLGSILGGPFVALGIFVVSHFNGIKNVVIGVLNWLIDRVNDVIKGINSVSSSIPFGLGPGNIGLIGHVGAGQKKHVAGYGTAAASGGVLGAVKGAAAHGSDSNPQEKHPAGGGTGQIVLHHTTKLGNRVVAEETVHFANWKTAAAGGFAL